MVSGSSSSQDVCHMWYKLERLTFIKSMLLSASLPFSAVDRTPLIYAHLFTMFNYGLQSVIESRQLCLSGLYLISDF